MKLRSWKGWYIDSLMMMMSLFLCGMSGKMGEDRKRGVKVKECVVLVGLVCNAVWHWGDDVSRDIWTKPMVGWHVENEDEM